MAITHDFVSIKADVADDELVRPSDWNADHAWPSWWTVVETPGAESLTIDGAVTVNALSYGVPTVRTIVSGAIDVTGLSYVIVNGEGAADDTLHTLNGGVDGQVLILQQGTGGGKVVTVSDSGGTPPFGIEHVNKEKTSSILFDLLGQVMLIYSASYGRWWCHDHGVNDILSPDGLTELIAGNGALDGQISSKSVLHAFMETATLGLWEFRGDLAVYNNSDDEGSHIRLVETTAPATPLSGGLSIYAKDKAGVSTLYIKKDNGAEVELG